MEIIIKKNKNQIYRITFGRDLPNTKCLYLISIIIEDYDDNLQLTYASFIKGFFYKNKKENE